MARGDVVKTKVQFKGKHEEFIVFVDDVDTYNKWKTDRSIPLAHVVSSFNVFVTGQGAQGLLGTPSDGTLDTEFGTTDDDKVIVKILEQGETQDMSLGERQGVTNDSFSSNYVK
ncbi:related to RNA binding protein [Cephalotrichum gorgonifer]|uniref:Related to RNA binding protein n=1 Tax=Cephalotrichum gorgonifer TaxID=2041049 RepID=A0AAE8MR77_9PEZI|nr:related to RNA binding protein [Cephalotrichum gorgonifer]